MSPIACTLHEWYIACSQGADVGQQSVANIKNDDAEWIDESTSTGSAFTSGNGECGVIAGAAFATSLPYRCCID